ncbi:XRN 5'-3' exonuclease, partial [Helicosporidium sp. ATCC 50920]
MGVPKFYRWLSERYPLINQPGATVFPVMDNLYLDMNGIIHNCTHGNREDVSLSEEEMVEAIFRYLDKIMHIMRPQKLLFMAVDGVAPRAKMNQQRSRRFKTAKEAEAARLEAEKAGGAPDKQRERFDSNCITPGTSFMARLSAHVKFFIRKRMAEDPVWRRPTIVFSGHDVPGEGEHKIMEYIRWMKRDPGYLPNTRHCLYGLDADLIMLALVSHEPHFCLLREVVSYVGGGRGQPSRDIFENPCQEHFVILHIGLLRDYLELEFSSGTALPFAFELERVIDDLILFCMLVGNDFLPPLPTLDIAEGSLDKLFELYKALLPEMGGYVSHGGHLHRGRLELLLSRLAASEAADLASRARDA